MLKQLIHELTENAPSYGPLPFWSWNDRLEEGELRRQIRNMRDLNMNGFFMHARGGLETEYMSEEWHDAVRACIDEARKLGMEAWAYDENGWPSVFAGGKLLEDPRNFTQFLILQSSDQFPACTDALAIYAITGNTARRVTAAVPDADRYYAVSVGTNNAYIDVLDPAIVRRFIDATHEEYKKRITPADFGTVMPGFFTDEPQHCRASTPWSGIFRNAFLTEYGYDPLEHLVKLFVDCDGFREFRYDYRKLVARLYIDGFVKQIYEWCEENGCRLTGHTIEEATITGQLRCCSGAMEFYRYQHIPGIDYLSRPLKKDTLAKQLGSVCAQTGRKKALTETFAMCGWDVSPRELKRIADLQYAGGVNLMCHHLYAYSMRGQRKRDYPAHFSEHLPWQKHLADFNLHYSRLGYALSRGEESARTLVIHPLHQSFMYYVRERDAEYAAENERLNALSDLLAHNQIAYHYGDETMMKDMARVEGATLKVGLCTYDHVIIPDVETLDSSTVSLLRDYLANGGKLLLLGQTPSRVDARPADLSWLTSSFTFEELKESEEARARMDGQPVSSLRITIRRTESGRILFLTNLSADAYKNVRLTVRNCKNLARIDLLTLEVSPLYGARDEKDDFVAMISIGDSESLLLVECNEPAALPLANYDASPRPAFLPPEEATLLSRPVNTLPLDVLSYSFDGQTFSEPVPLMQLKDELLQNRYEGPLTVKHVFTVREKPASLRLAAETMDYLSFTVNGAPVRFDGERFMDACFRTADLTPLIRAGENEICYTIRYYQDPVVYDALFNAALETLRNCLCFNVELECVYLYGDFRVETDPHRFTTGFQNALTYDGALAIAPAHDVIRLDNVVTDGLPFFAGVLHVGFPHRHEAGMPTTIRLDGRFAVCEVMVNGRAAKTALFESEVELSDLLREGDNRIELRLYNGNRNLLGPLHHSAIEPTNVTPTLFTGEKLWKNGAWSGYLKDRYCLVRFGLSCPTKKET